VLEPPPLLPPEPPLPPLPLGTAAPERSPPPPRGDSDSLGLLCATSDAENRVMTASAVLEVSPARFMTKLLGGPERSASSPRLAMTQRLGSPEVKQLHCQRACRESSRISA
jgi:hypothetical protein